MPNLISTSDWFWLLLMLVAVTLVYLAIGLLFLIRTDEWMQDRGWPSALPEHVVRSVLVWYVWPIWCYFWFVRVRYDEAPRRRLFDK